VTLARDAAGIVLAIALAAPPARAATEEFSVRLAEPDRGELLAGATVLRADVEPPAGATLSEVQFLVDGSPLAVDREPPYEAVWSAIDPLRDHLIRVTAIASDGRRAYALLSVPVLGMVERVSVTGRSPDFVLLDVTFLDAAGRPLVDVRREEVTVLEDGEAQVLDVFAPDDRPLAAELLLDASQSTRPRWPDLGRSTRLFAETLRPEDRAAVMAFNNRLVELAPLGSDGNRIETATEAFVDWGGTTRLYDAVSSGSLLDLGQEASRRRALVVLTDAFDFGSTLEVTDVEDYLLRSEVEMHAVLLFSEQEVFQQHGGAGGGQVAMSRGGLVQLARLTGGSEYETGTIPIAEAFVRIGERLRAQYLVGYNSVSRSAAGKPRRIEIRLNRPGTFDIRYRHTHYGSQTLGQYLAGEIARGPERRRKQAVRTASRMSDPVAVQAVVGALAQGKDLRAGVGREARLALLDRGADSIPYLHAAFESGERPVASRAAEVLVDLFARLARDDDGDAVQAALARLGDGDAGAGRRALEQIGRDRDLPADSRERLEEVLGSLGS
jgi:VWFA-related protein